jgi:hypothetical protein
VNDHKTLRHRLKTKAEKKYALTLPLVLIVAGQSDFSSPETLIRALFGDPLLRVDYAQGKVVGIRRLQNGVWNTSEGWENTGISAVIYAHMGSITFPNRDVKPIMVCHPFPRYPLSLNSITHDFTYATRISFGSETKKVVELPIETTLSKALALPPAWPHWESDTYSNT